MEKNLVQQLRHLRQRMNQMLAQLVYRDFVQQLYRCGAADALKWCNGCTSHTCTHIWCNDSIRLVQPLHHLGTNVTFNL